MTSTIVRQAMHKISVILPVFNERENLDELLRRSLPVLEASSGGSFEMIFVDDGSNDGSAEILDAYQQRDPRLKVVHFSRNFGHQAALQCGLDQAQGNVVVLMDSDLQDPPELLHDFLARWREGYNVVFAIRTKRKENAVKKAAYYAFYRTMKAIAEIDVPLDAGDFCLLDRRVVQVLVGLPERNRFLRGLRSWVGFQQIGVPYERGARHSGTPKYTPSKLFKLALAGYVGFSSMPLRLASWLGFISAGIGFAIGAWAVIVKLAGVVTPIGWASTIAVTLFVGGMQLFVVGIVGEYLSRMYDEVRKRPLYVVRSRVGFGEEENALRHMSLSATELPR